MKCERCRRKCGSLIMSKFDTAMLCMTCKTEEQKHPAYEEADRAELDAVRRGDYNFPGVGLPAGYPKISPENKTKE